MTRLSLCLLLLVGCSEPEERAFISIDRHSTCVGDRCVDTETGEEVSFTTPSGHYCVKSPDRRKLFCKNPNGTVSELVQVTK